MPGVGVWVRVRVRVGVRVRVRDRVGVRVRVRVGLGVGVRVGLRVGVRFRLLVLTRHAALSAALDPHVLRDHHTAGVARRSVQPVPISQSKRTIGGRPGAA